MSRNRSTDWNFPSWEQEQEMKRAAEIQARAFKEQLDKARYEAECAARKAARNAPVIDDGGPKKLNPIAEYVKNAVMSAPDCEAKRQQTLRKANEMQSKGGVTAAFGSILEAFCK